MLVRLPYAIYFLITLFKPIPFLLSLCSVYLSYYQYLPSMFCPFICLMGLSEIRHALKNATQIKPEIIRAVWQTT